MGIAKEIEFGFDSLAHKVASGLNVIHKFEQFVVNKAIPEAEKVAPEVEAVTALVPGLGAQAVAIERAGFTALGFIGVAVKDLDSADQALVEAATQKLTNLGLDTAMIQSFKTFFLQVGTDLAKVGVKL